MLNQQQIRLMATVKTYRESQCNSWIDKPTYSLFIPKVFGAT